MAFGAVMPGLFLYAGNLLAIFMLGTFKPGIKTKNKKDAFNVLRL